MTMAKHDDQAIVHRETCMEAAFTPLKDIRRDSAGNAIVYGHRRGSPRYKVELDVTIGSDHNFYGGFIENMSVGGVFIATHMLKPVGEVFEIAVNLPDQDAAVRGLGEVRWIRECSERSNVPPGMGVRFLELEPGSQARIESFLSHREPMFFDED